MSILCEMRIVEFFKLSSGFIALVGVLEPNVNKYIHGCKADLYIDDRYIKTISLIGEDIFSGGDIKKRIDKRAVKTTDDIYELLKNSLNNNIKLTIYDE